MQRARFQGTGEGPFDAIDAPEKAQPLGQRSKQVLSDLCFRETATINP
jgi:hypothetical protein